MGKAKKKQSMDKDDIESLVGHIEGHIVWLREALAAGDVESVRQQAVDIEGWASAIREAAGG